MDNTEHRPSVSSAVCYKDPKKALRWLEEAFGFEPSMVILGPNDELMHSEMRFGDGLLMVSSEWSPLHKSPASIDGLNIQTVHVQITTDIDAIANARARRARRSQWSRPPNSTATAPIAPSIPKATSGPSAKR